MLNRQRWIIGGALGYYSQSQCDCIIFSKISVLCKYFDVCVCIDKDGNGIGTTAMATIIRRQRREIQLTCRENTLTVCLLPHWTSIF